jgi:hypothetical protein
MSLATDQTNGHKSWKKGGCMRTSAMMGLMLAALVSTLAGALPALADDDMDRDHDTAFAGADPADKGLTILNIKSRITSGQIMGFMCAGAAPDAPVVTDPMDCGPQGVATILYHYDGDVYRPILDPKAQYVGEGRKVGDVSGNPAFPGSFFGLAQGPMQLLGPTLPWTCNGCALKINGTTFHVRKADMPLDGRAFTGLGPVVDPAISGKLSLRMAGCAGIDADDKGPYAGKSGTICVNGTFWFDQAFNGIGSSSCTLVLQTPLPTP